MLRPLRSSTLAASALVACAVAASTLAGRGAHADPNGADRAEANERCAVRLSISLLGKSADPSLVAAANPLDAVDAMVQTPEFADRYARFINSEFNGGPSTDATNDPVYYLAQYVILQKKPWNDMFLGAYDVVPSATAMDVKPNANGLGYFRTQSWMKRYAGNENAGYMLSASFRILSNTTGLTLTPSVGNPGDDRTGTGRAAQPCRSCHFDPWFALDHFARLLPKRVGQGATMTFTPPTEGPQQLLGKTIASDKELVQSLVDSDHFRFNQCRNVFKFLYGRPENQCEAPVFDKCVDALSSQGTIQAAVAVVAKDPSFCQ